MWEGVVTVDGGAERADSVANALAVVETELVAIHDAARPLLTPELVEEVVAALRADPDADAAIAATPVTDTIKRVAPFRRSLSPNDGDKERRSVGETVDRGELWRAQTPQVFRTTALRAAIEAGALVPGGEGDRAVPVEATDEAMLIEAAGGRVLICPAPAENLKVTTPLDLRLAELLLAER